MFLTVNCRSLEEVGGEGGGVGADLLLTASLLRTWANSVLGKNSLKTDSVALRSVAKLAFTPLKGGWTLSMLEAKHEMISSYI